MTGKDFINVKQKDKFHEDYELTRSDEIFAFFTSVIIGSILFGAWFIEATS